MYIKGNKILKFLTLASITTLSISPFIIATYVKNTNIKYKENFNTLNYSNSTYTKKFSSAWDKLNYIYDDKIIMLKDLTKIRVFSNKDVKSNSDIAKDINKQSAIQLGKVDPEGWNISNSFDRNSSAIDGIDELPTSAIGIEYERLDFNGGIATSGYINKDNLSKKSDFYSFTENLSFDWKGTALFKKNMGGVIVLKQAYKSGEINPWNLFSFVKDNSALSSEDLSSRYQQINNKNLPIWSDIEYKGNSAKWKSAQITFGTFENRWWFTDKGSSISISPKNINKLSIEQFKKLSIDEMIEYFDIYLHNTPRYCVSETGYNDSSISIYFNDQDNRVEVKVTTPRSYIPKFKRNSLYEIDKQWITRDSMTNTLYIPYDDFYTYNTNVTKSVEQNGIKASGDIANYNPKEILDVLGNGNDNSKIYNYLVQFIYDNRNTIFIDWPPESISSNPKDFFKFSTNDTYELVLINPTSMKFKFSAKGFFENGNMVDKFKNKKFELMINGLQKANIAATHSLNISDGKLYFPDSTTANSISYEQITSWVTNNINKIVYNLPLTANTIIDKVSKNESSGEIVVNFHVDKYFDSNGNEISKDLYLSSTIKGFDILENDQIWFILFITILSITIIVAIASLTYLFFYKRKKDDEKNKLNHKIITLSNNSQSNKLSMSNNHISYKNKETKIQKTNSINDQKSNAWVKTSSIYNNNNSNEVRSQNYKWANPINNSRKNDQDSKKRF